MGIKSTFQVQVKKQILEEDIFCLPEELRSDFEDYCESIFVKDPYKCFGLPVHALKGRLKGCMALEIEYEGDPNAYRLVYRVCEKPAPRRVEILSFSKHDLAYKRAKKRLGRDKQK